MIVFERLSLPRRSIFRNKYIFSFSFDNEWIRFLYLILYVGKACRIFVRCGEYTSRHKAYKYIWGILSTLYVAIEAIFLFPIQGFDTRTRRSLTCLKTHTCVYVFIPCENMCLCEKYLDLDGWLQALFSRQRHFTYVLKLFSVYIEIEIYLYIQSYNVFYTKFVIKNIFDS